MTERVVTIDQAIAALTDARARSPLGGDTVLVVSLSDSGLEQVHASELALVVDGAGSALMEVRAPWEREELIT